MEFLSVYVVTFSAISDTSLLLSWIIDKHFLSIIMTTLCMIPLPRSFKILPQGSAGLQFFGYIFTGSISASKFFALSKIINLFE